AAAGPSVVFRSAKERPFAERKAILIQTDSESSFAPRKNALSRSERRLWIKRTPSRLSLRERTPIRGAKGDFGSNGLRVVFRSAKERPFAERKATLGQTRDLLPEVHPMNIRGAFWTIVLFSVVGFGVLLWGWRDYRDSVTASDEASEVNLADLEGGA